MANIHIKEQDLSVLGQSKRILRIRRAIIAANLFPETNRKGNTADEMNQGVIERIRYSYLDLQVPMKRIVDDIRRAKEFIEAMTESDPDLDMDTRDNLLLYAISSFAELLAMKEEE